MSNLLFRVCSGQTVGCAMLLVAFFVQSVSPSAQQVPSSPSSDFNGNGVVDIPDFLLFVDVFGTKEGEEKYDAKYDLDGNGEIGIPDFLIFVDNFGKTVNSDNEESTSDDSSGGSSSGGGGTSPRQDPPTPTPPSSQQQQQVTSQVTISAGTSPVTEGTAATFTITASPAPTTAITVSVSVTEDGDVISSTPSSSVTIDANNATATLTVATDDDDVDESNSVVTAEVETGIGYTVGSSSSASVTVNDNDDPTPALTISAGTTPVTEGTAATFTITASSAPSSALTVNVDVSDAGGVISGTLPSTVTIDANTTTATLTFNTVDNQTSEPNSLITVEVESGTGYTVGSPAAAGVTVEDNDGPAPDLVVLALGVRDNIEAGETFWLLVTVHNQGDVQSAATTVRYYRSSDATITTSDTQEGTDAVNPLLPSTNSGETIRLTAPSTAGTYYYGACVDAVTGESDTTNNCSETAAQVDIE